MLKTLFQLMAGMKPRAFDSPDKGLDAQSFNISRSFIFMTEVLLAGSLLRWRKKSFKISDI